jgi:hypothetical protein
MTVDTYKAALRKAKIDLAHAMRQRDYWNLEIARVQQLVKSLSVSVESKNTGTKQEKGRKKLSLAALVGVRFTDVVYSIINSGDEKEGMTAAEVKKALEKRGYDLSDYSNPSALIHQTIKRLAKDGRLDHQGEGRYTTNTMAYFMSGMLQGIKQARKNENEK